MTADTLMGVRMGGFVDGILFHLILQFYNLLSARMPPNDLVSAKANMVWDGYFHAGTWVVTMLGLGLLVRASSRGEGPLPRGVFWGA